MKKVTIIIVIAILLLGAGLLFISKKSSKLTSPQTTQQQEKVPSLQETTSPSGTIPFNTNDNLDQVIQDLDQIE